MHIQDNIIKHHLRNVLFISGNACAGKTTMARMLAEKHGLRLYDMDQMYQPHRAIADQAHQPDTCYHMKDFHAQWTRPAEEQARWSMSSLAEQTEMVLVDLMQLAQRERVVADVLYSPAYTLETVDYRQFVFLAADKGTLRERYFDRPEKRGFYEFVKKQPLAELYFENILAGLERTNELERKGMAASGLLVLERGPGDTREAVLRALEAHFGL